MRTVGGMSTEDGDSGAGHGSGDAFVEPKPSTEDEAEFTFRDELRDIFGQPQIRRTGGHWTANESELPSPIEENPLEDALAPPFTVENQVCIEDRSAFVIRDEWGDELVRFRPSEVEATSGGRFRVSARQVQAVMPSEPSFRLSSPLGGGKVQRWLESHGHPGVSNGYVEVEPVRPQCKHLVLQLEPAPPSQASVVKQGWLHRYCAARRSMTGAFMGLSDEAIKACSLREPYDVESGRLLRKFDDTLLEKSRTREFYPMFQAATEAALSAVKDS